MPELAAQGFATVESPLKKRTNESERVLRDFMCVVRYVALRWNLSDIIMPQILLQGFVFLARRGNSVSEALGVRWGAPVPRDYKINEWFLTLTNREKDALLLARSQVKSQSLDTDMVFLIVSVHTASFNKDTGKHVAPTVLPSQVLFMELVKPARLLLGREALMMQQAFPVKLFLQAFEKYGF